MKNLIFIFADQWRRSATGFAKEENVITPNIDEFAKDSMVFTNAVSTGPLCSPARASILTGQYPQTHGVLTNCKTGLDHELKDSSITILDVLKQNNYYVGYIGKWHLHSPDENFSKNPISGARDWDAYTPPHRRHGVDYWYSYGAYDHHLKPHYWHNSHEMIEIDKWSVEHETDKALEFLDKNKDKPFSLFLSYNPPHTPLDLVPEKYVKMYENKDVVLFPNVVLEDVIDHTKTMEKSLQFTEDSLKQALKKYYAAITGIDENFGRIMNYLKENNLYENSVIVLTSDHGEMFASHGLWSKHVWYEESVGVPFLIRVPDANIGTTDVVLGSVDIMPTLLEILNLKVPNTVQGTNLKDAILENKQIQNYAFMYAMPGALKNIAEFKKENLDYKEYGWRAVKDKRYTFVLNRGYLPNSIEEKILYDNLLDKYQLYPQMSENELTKKYEKLIKEWLKKQNDHFKI